MGDIALEDLRVHYGRSLVFGNRVAGPSEVAKRSPYPFHGPLACPSDILGCSIGMTVGVNCSRSLARTMSPLVLQILNRFLRTDSYASILLQHVGDEFHHRVMFCILVESVDDRCIRVLIELGNFVDSLFLFEENSPLFDFC